MIPTPFRSIAGVVRALRHAAWLAGLALPLGASAQAPAQPEAASGYVAREAVKAVGRIALSVGDAGCVG